MTQVVELISFRDVKVGDKVRCGTTCQVYNVVDKGMMSLTIQSPDRILILWRDSSYILRSLSSSVLYFGIAND